MMRAVLFGVLCFLHTVHAQGIWGASPPAPPPAAAPSGPLTFCDVINEDLSICTCSEADGGFDSKLTCSLPIGPQNGQPVQGITPSGKNFPVLALGADMSWDLCSAPMNMKFEGSLQLGFLSDFPSDAVQLLNTGISDAINVARQDDPSFPPLSYDSSTYTLSISKTFQAGASAWTLSIPFFYVAVASFDAKLDITLTGDMESVTFTAKVDACIDLLGDLADLAAFVEGADKSLCASQLPNCAGDSSFSQCTTACYDGAPCTCKWVGDSWPCSDTTGYTNDCGALDLGTNSARSAADSACEALGSPDLLAIAGNPPWTIAQKTWQLTDACNDAMAYQTQVVIPTTAGPEPDSATLSSLETYFGNLAHLPAELVVATASSSAPYTYTITLKATSSSKASSHLTAVNGPTGVETASKAAQALNSATGSTTFAVAEKPTHSVGPISSGGGPSGPSGPSGSGGSSAPEVVIGVFCAVVIIVAGVYGYLRYTGKLGATSSAKTLAEQEVTAVPEITDKTTEEGSANADSPAP